MPWSHPGHSATSRLDSGPLHNTYAIPQPTMQYFAPLKSCVWEFPTHSFYVGTLNTTLERTSDSLHNRRRDLALSLSFHSQPFQVQSRCLGSFLNTPFCQNTVSNTTCAHPNTFQKIDLHFIMSMNRCTGIIFTIFFPLLRSSSDTPHK